MPAIGGPKNDGTDHDERRDHFVAFERSQLAQLAANEFRRSTQRSFRFKHPLITEHDGAGLEHAHGPPGPHSYAAA